MPTNVLVVDDHRTYRETFCELLQVSRPHMQIVAAETGMQALILTSRIDFDLLIIDYHLKAMTGGDIIRHLRARSRDTGWRMPPVVLISAYPDANVFARLLSTEAFLPKPVEMTQLCHVLDTLLGLREDRAFALGGVGA